MIVDISKKSVKKILELIVFTAFLVVALWKFNVVLDVLKAIWGIAFPGHFSVDTDIYTVSTWIHGFQMIIDIHNIVSKTKEFCTVSAHFSPFSVPRHSNILNIPQLPYIFSYPADGGVYPAAQYGKPLSWCRRALV